MSKHKNTLSFEVESIREYQIYGVTVFDTTLRSYTRNEVGTKVDFEQIEEQGS